MKSVLIDMQNEFKKDASPYSWGRNGQKAHAFGCQMLDGKTNYKC